MSKAMVALPEDKKMLALKIDNTKETTTDLGIVIRELEKSLSVMEANYRKAVTNIDMLKNQLETDELTKLLRRGAFMRKMQELMNESAKEGQDVQLMMIDVDHFKKVNDTYGHQTGDLVLERVSALVRDYLKGGAFAGRYGGEEIIVAVQASFAEAVQIAEGIRRAVREHEMTSTDSKDFHVTLSIGIASSRSFGHEVEALIAEADAALYRAKHGGRDQVALA